MARRQRVAVTVLFLVNGAAFSSWLPRVPEVRDRLGLSLGELGAVLLGVGLGGVLSSVAGGALVDHLGSRRSAVLAGVALSAGLPLIALAPNGFVLAAVLVMLGAVDVVADIAMNVQAADVQRRSPASVVQRFHAAWSVGAVVGAAAASAAAAAGIGLGPQLVVTAVVLVIAAVSTRPALSPVDESPRPLPEGARRRPALLLLAATALVVAVVEGAPGEWAAVFGRDVHDAGPGVAGLGYLAVATGMVLGRLGGDRATDRLGASAVFRAALGLVGAGLALVVASPAMAVAIIGFGVVGVGVSVLFPTIYLRSAEMPGVAAGLGVGVMSTGARLGFLLSPLVIGSLAGATSLRFALAAMVGTCAALAAMLDAALSRAGRGAT